jgi:hypothetical protein
VEKTTSDSEKTVKESLYNNEEHNIPRPVAVASYREWALAQRVVVTIVEQDPALDATAIRPFTIVVTFELHRNVAAPFRPSLPLCGGAKLIKFWPTQGFLFRHSIAFAHGKYGRCLESPYTYHISWSMVKVGERHQVVCTEPTATTPESSSDTPPGHSNDTPTLNMGYFIVTLRRYQVATFGGFGDSNCEGGN